ncbi:hypothetical protein FIE12Z_1204 [Fusarium flagelliforme]|uniref:Uncharacterized protein n=1 Tax=Fusarium flagelliforme TaxID=2675880 RepID=A0A395N4M7_9HYPO|nr:hypothetical protein FIE12Z_1204 [Fusarium flagelliforme]
MSPGSWRSNNYTGIIDDFMIVPAGSSITGNVRLPTYQPLQSEIINPEGTEVGPNFSHPGWVELSIEGVLKTLQEESFLARRILFEGARLRQPFFASSLVKLTKDARSIDMELIEMGKVLGDGYSLIQIRWQRDGKQKLVIEGKLFQNTLACLTLMQTTATAKEKLYEFEKIFHAKVLGKLKAVAWDRRVVRSEEVVDVIKCMTKDISEIYDKLVAVHDEGIEAIPAAQVQEEDVKEEDGKEEDGKGRRVKRLRHLFRLRNKSKTDI